MLQDCSLRHPSKPILIHIPTADIVAIDELATQTKSSRSALMRHAVRILLQREIEMTAQNASPKSEKPELDSDAAWRKILLSINETR